MMLYPIMEAVRSGGDLENIGGSGRYIKDVVCPDGCVLFRLTARPLGNETAIGTGIPVPHLLPVAAVPLRALPPEKSGHLDLKFVLLIIPLFHKPSPFRL